MSGDLERDLRLALRRRDAPPGLRARILAGARPRQGRRLALAGAIAAAVLLAAGPATFAVHRQRGLKAKRDAMVALRLAAASFRAAQSTTHRLYQEVPQ